MSKSTGILLAVATLLAGTVGVAIGAHYFQEEVCFLEGAQMDCLHLVHFTPIPNAPRTNQGDVYFDSDLDEIMICRDGTNYEAL
jgi:hypothetical protein